MCPTSLNVGPFIFKLCKFNSLSCPLTSITIFRKGIKEDNKVPIESWDPLPTPVLIFNRELKLIMSSSKTLGQKTVTRV